MTEIHEGGRKAKRKENRGVYESPNRVKVFDVGCWGEGVHTGKRQEGKKRRVERGSILLEGIALRIWA